MVVHEAFVLCFWLKDATVESLKTTEQFIQLIATQMDPLLFYDLVLY